MTRSGPAMVSRLLTILALLASLPPCAAHATAAQDVPQPAGVQTPLAGMTGRVVDDDGAPLAGLEVLFLIDGAAGAWSPVTLLPEVDASQALNLPGRSHRTHTDADGRFAWTAMPPQRQWLILVDAYGRRATALAAVMSGESGERVDLGDVRAALRDVLVGRVIDDADAPVVGAVVRLGGYLDMLRYDRGDRLCVRRESPQDPWQLRPAWSAGTWDKACAVPETRTDAHGRFELIGMLDDAHGRFELTGLLDDAHRVLFVHEQFRPHSVRWQRGAQAATVDLGDVVLARGESLSGRVLDAAGEPVAGATVFAGEPLFAPPADPWTYPHRPDGADPGGAEEALLVAVAISRDDGRFDVSGLQGSAVLAARGPAGGGLTIRSVTTDDDEVALHLDAPRSLELVAAQGDPPPDRWRVSLHADLPPELLWFAGLLAPLAADRPLHYAGRTARIDGLAAMRYLLRVQAPGRAVHTQVVDLAAGSTRIEVPLAAVAGGTVRVVDAQSLEPVAGARIEAFTRGTNADRTTQTAEHAESDADGRAAFDRLGEGSLLIVEHPAYAMLVRGTTAATQHEVGLHRGGTLSVHAFAGGQSPANTLVMSLSRPDAPFLTRAVLAGPDGAARFAHVPAGRWELRITPCEVPALRGPIVHHHLPEPMHNFPTRSVDIAEGETTEVEIDLLLAAAAGTAHGELVGHALVDDRPAAGYRLAVRSVAASSAEYTIVLPADGSFRFPQVRAGPVTLSLAPSLTIGPPWDQEKSRRWWYHTDVPSDGSKTASLHVRLAALRGRVVWDDTGAAVDGAVVWISQATRSGAPTLGTVVERADADGRFALDPASAGNWTVRVTAIAALPWQGTSFEIAAGETVDLPPIRLRRGIPVSGRVILPPTARQLEQVTLKWNSEHEPITTTASAPDFCFETRVEAEGTYLVMLDAGSESNLLPVLVEVPARGLSGAVLAPTPGRRSHTKVHGRIELPDGAPPIATLWYHQGGTGHGAPLHDDAFSATVKIGPCTFSFHVETGEQPYLPITVDVPADGIESLVLRPQLKP